MKEIEYLNIDLDLFYEINGLPIHIATAGGIIPQYYQNIDLADYNLPKQVRELPLLHNKDELIFNPKLRELIKYDDNINDVTMIIESLYSKDDLYDYDIAAILNDDNALFDFYIEKIYGLEIVVKRNYQRRQNNVYRKRPDLCVLVARALYKAVHRKLDIQNERKKHHHFQNIECY